MFKALAFAFLLALVVALAVVPYRFPGLAKRLLDAVRGRVLGARTHAVFGSKDDTGADSILWLRVWCAISVVTIVVLAVGGSVLAGEDAPGRLGMALFVSGVGMASSSVLVLSVLAALRYFPEARARAALGRHGYSAFWVADPDRAPGLLREDLAAKAKASRVVRILDVTGYEILGKGQGLSGGLLSDMLSTMTSVPVHLLLLEPESRTLDPDHKHATVYQTLLAESEMTPATYQRKIRATLDTIEALNEKRSPEARITVRFYSEKPAFRALLFEGAVVVFPWVPKGEEVELPFLEVSREAEGHSLYEGFRRQFVRLWRATAVEKARSGSSAAVAKPPSTVVRRRSVPEAVA